MSNKKQILMGKFCTYFQLETLRVTDLENGEEKESNSTNEKHIKESTQHIQAKVKKLT